MDKNRFSGTTQIACGSYIGYQGIRHGLPRLCGIRIENHITSKENARLIKKSGNILDPSCGGKNGFSSQANISYFIENSQNYVHISGAKPDSQLNKCSLFKKFKFLKKPCATVYRKLQTLMYKVVANGKYDECGDIVEDGFTLKNIERCIKLYADSKLHKNSKCFYVPGIDSYFNKEFISDVDEFAALKLSKPLKAYNNKFSAMIAGLKQFGLKGIKENKSRVAFGAGLLSLGLYGCVKLIDKGVKNVM